MHEEELEKALLMDSVPIDQEQAIKAMETSPINPTEETQDQVDKLDLSPQPLDQEPALVQLKEGAEEVKENESQQQAMPEDGQQ